MLNDGRVPISGDQFTKHQMGATTKTAAGYLAKCDDGEAQSPGRVIPIFLQIRPRPAGSAATKAIIITGYIIKAHEAVDSESPVWTGGRLMKMGLWSSVP